MTGNATGYVADCCTEAIERRRITSVDALSQYTFAEKSFHVLTIIYLISAFGASRAWGCYNVRLCGQVYLASLNEAKPHC